MDWKRFFNQPIPEADREDYCKQVGRTWKKKNYSDEQIELIVDRITSFLPPDKNKTVLELACGNGMLTYRIAPFYRSITALDFSAPLIAVARERFGRGNIQYVLGDALELSSIDKKFDYVLLYFSFQHFVPKQVEVLFDQIAKLLKPEARIFLGEVADGDRIWNFYRGFRGKALYWANRMRNTSIIGYWWRPSELLTYCQSRRWALSIHYQDERLPNHYFRYDALIQTGD